MSIAPEKISIQVGLDAKNAQKGLKNIEKTLKGFGKIGKANNRIFSDFLRLAGFAGLTKMTLDAAHFAHSMEVLGNRTGLATEKLAKMSNVWRAWGTDAKSLSTFAQKLAGDLALRRTTGGSAFYSAFRSMGINPLTAGGELKDLKELFGDVADYTQRMKRRGIKEFEIYGILSSVLGMPPEVIQRVMGGRESWNKYYEETAGRVGTITGEETRRNEDLNRAFSETMVNFEIAIQKTTAALSEILIPVLENISQFAKENPKTTSAIGVGLAGGGIYGGARFLHWLFGGAGSGATAGAGASTGLGFLPTLLGAIGLAATPMEILGYNALGQKIQKTKPDLWDDFVNSFAGSTNANPMHRYNFYANLLKDMFESGDISFDELMENVKSNRFGGAYTGIILRKMTENLVSSGGDGLTWQEVWLLSDLQKAERANSYSSNFTQNNNIVISEEEGRPVADSIVKRLGEVKIPNVLTYRNMTGVAN